jgi:hypothetical protein
MSYILGSGNVYTWHDCMFIQGHTFVVNKLKCHIYWVVEMYTRGMIVCLFKAIHLLQSNC